MECANLLFQFLIFLKLNLFVISFVDRGHFLPSYSHPTSTAQASYTETKLKPLL